MIANLSDDSLQSTLRDLCREDKRRVADIVEYLAEVDHRRLYAPMGYHSLFDYCLKHLKMSENEAGPRIAVARLVREYPQALAKLRSGDIHLSALAMTRKHLTQKNADSLLKSIEGKTLREVEFAIAAHCPQQDVEPSIRKLPSPAAPPPATPTPKTSAAERTIPMFAMAPVVPTMPSPPVSPPLPPPPTPTARALKPLSEDRHRVQFTVSTEVREKIERATRLMSHRNRSGDIENVIEAAMDVLLEKLEKERLGKLSKPRSTRPKPQQSTARISRAVRREVFDRDGEQCTFVSKEGVRCEAKDLLEIDHIHPRAKGGEGTTKNARVLCATHNRLAAEHHFGESKIAAHIAKSQAERAGTRHPILGALFNLANDGGPR